MKNKAVIVATIMFLLTLVVYVPKAVSSYYTLTHVIIADQTQTGSFTLPANYDIYFPVCCNLTSEQQNSIAHAVINSTYHSGCLRVYATGPGCSECDDVPVENDSLISSDYHIDQVEVVVINEKPMIRWHIDQITYSVSYTLPECYDDACNKVSWSCGSTITGSYTHSCDCDTTGQDTTGQDTTGQDTIGIQPGDTVGNDTLPPDTTIYNAQDVRQQIAFQNPSGSTPSGGAQSAFNNIPSINFNWSTGNLDRLWNMFFNNFTSHFYFNLSLPDLTVENTKFATSSAVGFGMRIPKLKHYQIAMFSPKIGLKASCEGIDFFAELRGYLDLDKLIDWIEHSVTTTLWAVAYGLISSVPAVQTAMNAIQNLPSHTWDVNYDACHVFQELSNTNHIASLKELSWPVRMCVVAKVNMGETFEEALDQCRRNAGLAVTKYSKNNTSLTAKECWRNRLQILTNQYPEIDTIFRALAGDIVFVDTTENRQVKYGIVATPVGNVEQLFYQLRDTIMGSTIEDLVDAYYNDDVAGVQSSLRTLFNDPVFKVLLAQQGVINLVLFKAIGMIDNPALRRDYAVRLKSYWALEGTEWMVKKVIDALRTCSTTGDVLTEAEVIEALKSRKHELSTQLKALQDKLWKQYDFTKFLSDIETYYAIKLREGASKAYKGEFKYGG